MKGLRRLLSMLLACCLTISVLPVGAMAASATTADGFIAPIEAPDPSATEISTAAELATMSGYGSYVLTADIDLSSYGAWSPIGTTLASAFHGKLDGQGHKITGLKVSSVFTSATLVPPPFAVGLFGVCDGAQIKNLEVEGVSVSVDNTSGYGYTATEIHGVQVYAGGLVGYATNGTVIYNCHNSGGTVSASASGEAQSLTHAGGLVGYAESAVISYSYNRSIVNTSYSSTMFGFDSYAGGLLGYCSSEAVIDRSYNSGAVTASVGDYTTAYTGGLIGGADTAARVQIENCYNEGAIQTRTGVGSSSVFGGETAYAGGIAGKFSGSVSTSYNSGTVAAKVTDAYGLGSGSAYAGGICAYSTDSSTIGNCASVQSSVTATKGGSGTRYQYQISCGGVKTNNIATSAVASGTKTDANLTLPDSQLKAQSVYQQDLGWDFSQVWMINEGNGYPTLKQVDIESEPYTDEYIAQHLAFISSGQYANITQNYRWAKIYWSEENNFKSNTGEFLYKVIDGTIDIVTLNFGDLFDNGNPYKIILADYIASQSVQDDVYSLYKVEVPHSLDKLYTKVSSFFKANWKDGWGELSDEDIFWLLHYPDAPAENWITQDFEKHIGEIVYDSKNNGFATVLGVTEETLSTIIEAKKKYYDKPIDWLNGLFQYVANVDAYLSASQEFKTVLRMMCNHLDTAVADSSNRKMLREALEDYIQFDDSENVRRDMVLNYIKDTAADAFWSYAVKQFTKSVNDWIKTFPGKVQSALAAIGWAAETTWKLCDYITQNGKLMDCRMMLRSNAYFEAALYETLTEISGAFVSDPTIENAYLFDAGFKFFKECQIYSMDICISYFDTYQTAWLPAIKNLSNTFLNSAIEEVQINKLFLYNTYCHGSTYFIGGKTITIACPTNVYLYDEADELIAAIENNEIKSLKAGLFASVINNVKVIAVPAEQNYRVEIVGTDDGKMDYMVSEYNADLENVQMTVYSDIALTPDGAYDGAVNKEIKTEPSTYNLTSNSSETVNEYTCVTEQSNTPVESISITNVPTTVAVGEQYILTADISPADPTVKTVIWTSSVPSVLSVSENGEIEASAHGSATITVRAMSNGVSNSYTFHVEKGTQAPPEIPELHDKTTNSITLKAIVPNVNGAAAEYSMDSGTTWQSSPVFTGLLSNTEYSFCARYGETENHLASAMSDTLSVITDTDAPPEKTRTEITGTAAESVPYDGRPHRGYTGAPTSAYTGEYEFLYTGRNDTVYSSVTAPTNAGDYTVTIQIPDTDEVYTGSISLDFTIAKASQAAPSVSINYSTETLSTVAASMEYSVDGGTIWHDCTADMPADTFGWDGSAEKSVGFRAKADTNHLAGEIREVVIPSRPAAPAGLHGVNETFVGEKDGQITGLTAGTAYEISTDNGKNWADVTLNGTSIVALAPGAYQVRSKATETAFVGDPATVEIATGVQHTYTLNVAVPSFAPAAYGYPQPEARPLVITSTGNSDATVTNVALSGTNAGSFTLNTTAGTIIPAGGKDESTYAVQPKAGLGAGTYTATVTVAYNSGSTATANLTFTVMPAAQTAPVAPELESKTFNAVTLKAIASNANGAVAEYSKDEGTTWQTSPVFADLAANTAYSFVARYAAVGNYKASPAGAALDVTTLPVPAADGSSGTLGQTGELAWRLDEGVLTVTGNLGEKDMVLAACWDASNRFIGATILRADQLETHLPDGFAAGKLLWLGADLAPKCPCSKIGTGK